MQLRSIPTIWRAVTDRGSVVLSVVALGWSIYYTVILAVIHNSGPEAYGVLVAALAVVASVGNLVALRSPRTRSIVTIAVVALWAIVAFGGIAGTVAHVVGPVAGHGPVDLRPRPITAPLVFTALGAVGAAALILGQRARSRVLGFGSEKE